VRVTFQRRCFVTHLFFDAGNTLVYVNMEVVSRALAGRGVRRSADELWRAEHGVRRAIDHPDVIRESDDRTRWALYFRSILAACGVTRESVVAPALRELEDYHARSNLWEVVPPDLPMQLDRLRRRFRLGVISNSNGTVREKLRRVGLLPYFDLVLDSHEERVEKPDPRLFRIALERARARPERSLHVGDFYHIDVVGARAAGMEAVLLDPGDAHRDKPVPRVPDLRRFADCL
jgi:putative hydrolase of the HAD superfamily